MKGVICAGARRASYTKALLHPPKSPPSFDFCTSNSMKLSLAAFLTITRLAASQISGRKWAPGSHDDSRLTFSSDGRPYAGCSDVPDTVKFVNETYILPDPFHFLDRHAVRTEKGWSCRAAQLRTLFQRYELGDKPLVNERAKPLRRYELTSFASSGRQSLHLPQTPALSLLLLDLLTARVSIFP